MLLLLRNHDSGGPVTPPIAVRGRQLTRGYDAPASLGYERTDTSDYDDTITEGY